MSEAMPSRDQVDAAIQLMVVVEFEGKLRLSDSFKNTLSKIKNREGLFGTMYHDYNDAVLFPEFFSCDNFLTRMADSLVEVHIDKGGLGLSPTEEELENAALLLQHLLLNRYWLQKIRAWTETPENWYEFITSTKNFEF